VALKGKRKETKVNSGLEEQGVSTTEASRSIGKLPEAFYP